MKEYRSKEGPYPIRLHYESAEIDQICVDALREAGLLPNVPSPIKIDLFLEKYFKVIIDYRDLDRSIMGSAIFNSKGAVTGIIVASWIEEDGTAMAERRVRSTLAHEGGHGLLHSRLFMADSTGDLFGRRDSQPERPLNFMCRPSDISPSAPANARYDGKWWEWQANRAIGGLLLPKVLVRDCAAQFMQEKAFGPVLSEPLRPKAEQQIADVFDVNPVVARIRLQEMFPVEKNRNF